MGIKAILSGRYEIPHPGHIKTIRREAKIYDELTVLVVDNPDALMPPAWILEMLEFATADMSNVCIKLDTTHYGRCTQGDVNRLPEHDVFLSSNPDVTERLRELGVNVREIERTEGYSGTEILDRIMDNILGKVCDDE